jgi:hypothetical protein
VIPLVAASEVGTAQAESTLLNCGVRCSEFIELPFVKILLERDAIEGDSPVTQT